ncbi:MAG: sugar ABC transporter substrate-binding protein [Planctomycetes bacterium]|nr:sugar ABC transporter substrate-binding protein [Planctomycetota bacterium]
MTRRQTGQPSRRGFLKQAAVGTGLGVGALLPGCRGSGESGPGTGRRLRAAFSNGGLQGTWCKLGKDAAELWGNMLNIEVVWKDGEYDTQIQRDKLDLIVDEPWDFCCFQANQTNALEEPTKRLRDRGIPVISMDTLLVERDRLREVGVWCQVTPDHVAMAETSTQYLMDKIGGRGTVIHIGGDSAHSGARDRNQGFMNIVKKYPDVKVAGDDDGDGDGVRWCDWNLEKARDQFESFLGRSEPIAGAFFHNDDMALACVPAIKGTPHEKMVVTGVDGQANGLEGVRDGLLAATTVNPACLVHVTALFLGQFIARNEEKVEDVPLEIVLPSPLVSLETGNLDAMFYMSDPKHCLI